MELLTSYAHEQHQLSQHRILLVSFEWQTFIERAPKPLGAVITRLQPLQILSSGSAGGRNAISSMMCQYMTVNLQLV